MQSKSFRNVIEYIIGNGIAATSSATGDSILIGGVSAIIPLTDKLVGLARLVLTFILRALPTNYFLLII